MLLAFKGITIEKKLSNRIQGEIVGIGTPPLEMNCHQSIRSYYYVEKSIIILYNIICDFNIE